MMDTLVVDVGAVVDGLEPLALALDDLGDLADAIDAGDLCAAQAIMTRVSWALGLRGHHEAPRDFS